MSLPPKHCLSMTLSARFLVVSTQQKVPFLLSAQWGLLPEKCCRIAALRDLPPHPIRVAKNNVKAKERIFYMWLSSQGLYKINLNVGICSFYLLSDVRISEE